MTAGCATDKVLTMRDRDHGKGGPLSGLLHRSTAQRAVCGVSAALLLGALGIGTMGAQAQTKPTGAAPTATAKPKPKKPVKKRDPEYHGEAAPRDIVPGSKVILALMELGTLRLDQGQFQGAIDAYTDAVKRFPLEPEPLYLRGVAYERMGRLQESETDFRAGLELDPKGTKEQTHQARAALASVMVLRGQHKEAIEMLDLVVRDRPGMFEAQYTMGVAQDAVKNYPAAIGAFSRATTLKPYGKMSRVTPPDALYHLGDVLRKAGRPEEALAPTREAVRLAPDRPHTHFSLGSLLNMQKKYDEAMAELQATVLLAEPLLASGSPPEKDDAQYMLFQSHFRMGVISLRQNRLAEAAVSLEKAKLYNATPEVLTYLGEVRVAQQDYPRAEIEFRAALTKNPALHAARLHLATLFATTRRCPLAQQELALVPDEPAYAETIKGIKVQCDYDRMSNQPSGR